MEDRETPRISKYGESKTTRIMMATVTHVTSGWGLRKFQADGFLFDRVYKRKLVICTSTICTISELLTATQRTSVSCASSHILFQNIVCVVGPLNYLSFIVFIFAINLAVSLGRPIALPSCGHERSVACHCTENSFAPQNVRIPIRFKYCV